MQPESYLELFDVAVELRADADRYQLLDRAKAVTARLGGLFPRFEQYVFLLRCLELAATAGASRESLEAVRVLFRELAGDVSPNPDAACKFMARPEFRGRICVLRIPETESYFLCTDSPGLSLDSIPQSPGIRSLVHPGAIQRDALGTRICQAELQSALRRDKASRPEILFCGRNLEFRYPGSDVGLHNFSFEERSGRMIGIMGVSGAGKSTLLSILNGQTAPDSGTVAISREAQVFSTV